MNEQDIRLGFVSARSAFADQDGIWVDAGVGRLVDVWASSFGQLTLAMSHAPRRMHYHDHRLNIEPAQFVPMPWLPSVAGGFHKALGCRRAIRKVEQLSDALIVQLPFAAPLALVGARKPRVYHICTDILLNAQTSDAYRGIKRLPATLIGRAIDRLQRNWLHDPHSRTVANGEPIYRHYGSPAGRAVVSATISAGEILSIPRRRPAVAPFRILFVGFIRPEKGIDTLLDAYEQLLAEIPDAELVIVGGRSMADRGMTEFVDQRVAQLNTKGNVKLLGQIGFGPDLFQCFADADVLALPSRSEGTPRVLIESRAFACPVVGTTVGGIPSSITHEVDGLLIEPNDPSALRKALLRIARDADLRARLIEGGLARARTATMENYARAIADEVKLALSSTANQSHDSLSRSSL